MKHFYKALLLFVTLFGISTFHAEAQSVTIDGLKYEIADGAATLTGPVDKQLTELIIPEAIEYDGISYPVTSIGNTAFHNCQKLTKVVIPPVITSIGESTFQFCESITELTIPQSVTNIGGYAFWGCTALKTVTIPDGDSELSFGVAALAGCHIETLYLGRNITDDPFAGNAYIKNLTISDSVTSIPEDAFNSCSGLTSIEIPNTVISIGDRAFISCSALTDVTISDGDTALDFGENVFTDAPIERLKLGRNFTFSSDYIPGHPFYNHSSITSLNISNTVTEIPDYAFYGCSGITSVEIPNSVTSIGMYAFQGCSKLTDVTISDGNNDLTFGENVFTETPIETLYLGRDIAESSKMPFRGLTTLKNLTIGSTVTATPMHVFSDCSALTDVRIADGDSELQFEWFPFENAPVETVYMGRNFSGTPFSNIASIKNLTISGKVTTLPDYAFCGTGITSLNIPESVIFVDAFAFKGCSGLTEVNIADSDTAIDFDNDVFSTSPIETLYLGRNLSNSPFEEFTSIKNLSISNSVTLIPDRAFGYCSGITSLEIPNSVTSIGGYAFFGCTALTDVKIADGDSELQCGKNAFYNAWIETLYLGRNVANNPFADNESLKNLTISNTVTSLPDNAFSGCSGLTAIEIPNSVTSIGLLAFNGCSALSDVTVADGDNDLTFGNTVFESCPIETVYLGRNTAGFAPFENIVSLTTLNIGDKVSSIANGAFMGCTGLTSLTLPASVNEIGEYAFDGCSGLTEIACESLTPPAVNSNSFDETTYTSATLSVPEEARATYLSDPVWSKFKSIHILVESITLDPEKFRGYAGDTFQIKATILPADATDKTIEWSSSNDKIASVDPDGVVTLIKEGYCEITAKATDGSEVEAVCVIDILTLAQLIDGDENADIEVYNLEGLLIARSLKHLTPGLYIVKQGNTTIKIRI